MPLPGRERCRDLLRPIGNRQDHPVGRPAAHADRRRRAWLERPWRVQFLSGYTAKVAGTECGITEPRATFSACFGAPFMALNPVVYAKLLGEKIARHQVEVWLVNTGWSGGPYGTGQRIKLSYTRAMVRAVLSGGLAHSAITADPVFGVQLPQACPDVPPAVLQPRTTWPNPQAYDTQAQRLSEMFGKNFQQFANDVSPEVRTAGPRQAGVV